MNRLQSYRAKRNFAISPEPADEAAASDGRLFVVQKHWASSLHYDFRLELDGTLRSWAVPKGPSLDPTQKRMAVQVEDHPVAYAAFEGTIPAKQYGAGKVIVWDHGTWQALGDGAAGLRDGNLKFELRGHKLHGRWALVRMKGKSERQVPWLLIKERDEHSRPAAEYSVVDELPDSVARLARSAAVKATPKTKSAAAAAAGTPTATATAASPAAAAALADKPRAAPRAAAGNGAAPVGSKAALPDSLSPQLATLGTTLPADPADWIYEIKFDGYRLLARIDGAQIRLFTRNGNDWTAKLAPLRDRLAALALPSGWYDGEIVVPDEHGVPDFGALQQAFDAASAGAIVYYLFDLPFHAGRDLREQPLHARRALLQAVLAKAPSEQVRFSDEFDAAPASMLESACRLGLEGIIAKRRDAPYRSRRSADWIKLKCSQRQEFVIGGWTEPQGTRSGLGALVLGVYDDAGALQHAGNVGSGFNQRTLSSLRQKLDALPRRSSPFASGSAIEGKPHWVQPTLVAEVSFGEWTRSGHIRHAVFRGLRTDKIAADVVREQAPAKTTASARPAPQTMLPSTLRVTHPERVIDASTGITKIDVVRYYALVSALMMVHLKGRPVSLVRAPAGVGGELFFQKHAETDKLPGIRQLDPDLSAGHPALLEVTGKPGLLSAAQWNVIEFHTMNAQAASFAHPDRLVFDLDPGEGVAWPQVQEAAELMRSFLGELGLVPFLKTSGGKGLHVVVPIRKLHDWATCKGFSQAVVVHIAKLIPQRFSAKSGPKNRVGKIFIDYLRNGSGSTTACAWTTRARPGMGISVPVAWSELASLRGGAHWSLRSVHERLDQGNAPWSGYARAARSLSAPMTKMRYTSPTV